MGGVQSTTPGVPPAQQLGDKSGREADVGRFSLTAGRGQAATLVVVVVDSYRFLSVSCLRVLVAVCRFIYGDGSCVPVVVEGADVVFLWVAVFVGDGDSERDDHVVAERTFLCVEARVVDVLLERSCGFVAVDDSVGVVGDGEGSSVCEAKCVVSASNDSLAYK